MGFLYVFMGKSASGKDTLYHNIMEKHKEWKSVITYTTRPIRKGEVNGKEYYFVSEQQMLNWKKEGKVVECRCYQTVKGAWYYFTLDDGQIDFSRENRCMISTLEGYEQIRSYYGKENVKPLYIEVPDMIRIERSLEREKRQETPCVAEVCRRFLADEEDFSTENLQRLGIREKIENIRLEQAVLQIEKTILADKKC